MSAATGARPRRRARTPEEWRERAATQRRMGALEKLADAIEDSSTLEIPAPVTDVKAPAHGRPPKLFAEAFELARQVYYLQHGTIADCARAIIGAGLSDTDDLVQVRERLDSWWGREQWPKRSTMATFAIRDANNDGGLYRSTRICVDVVTGHGPAPKGNPCAQSTLADSEYCFHHDPRPEYVEARRIQAERLTAGRLAVTVPLAPFQQWCEQTRRQMLADAKATRRVHPNATGWELLGTAMNVDQSLLTRWIKGKHSARGRGPVTRIKAATVERYLEPFGVAFRDVYGHDPPASAPEPACPRCGKRISHGSELCRLCYEATRGTPCTYVNRAGRRCNVITGHESGICGECRRITERVPKPRVGKTGALDDPVRLILALGEYRDVPIHAWVSKRMWAVDAGGVRACYQHRKALTGQLVKTFRKHGWRTAADAARAYDELVARHGLVTWPTDESASIDAEGMVLFGPFREWLGARKAEAATSRGGCKALADRTGIHPDTLSQWLRAVGVGAGKTTVRRAIVDDALERWGDGTTYADIYDEASS